MKTKYNLNISNNNLLNENSNHSSVSNKSNKSNKSNLYAKISPRKNSTLLLNNLNKVNSRHNRKFSNQHEVNENKLENVVVTNQITKLRLNMIKAVATIAAYGMPGEESLYKWISLRETYDDGKVLLCQVCI